MKNLTFCLLLLSWMGTSAQRKISWPHHKKAVIVLTYDDALNSQLDKAIPQLDVHHFKGTFFLTGELNSITIPKWRAAAKNGHELANHTLFHPCLSATMPDNPANAAERYSIYQIIREIYTMNNFLYALDGKGGRTYAYPCTETEVGGKSYVDSLRKSGLIKYARVGGDVEAVVTDFKKLDPLRVPSYGLDENTSAVKLIAFAKRVEKSGGMGIFMFHGIGGDYITTSTEAHKELLNYLAKNRKDLWVATFQQAMDYITRANKGK
ncbi:polysaccharide deacetylase family protein [Mucilaginibacter sp. OK098]|uniref:polysaccharide deacetylase family protein n=1 Tax=Mucilaginibacter sp. OK098 TaxID=1855297 RepID=UPI00091BEC74|nr:polysaccharide deacetylase family protein [Mucilaginibacter sp. OK098]SHM97238.1 Peptidoglycan/xylan/chitin deacetylase, PgdA/CDA1 family [Mucilaginibacter sp. OK098]